jgi:hypothetical protein
VAILSFLLLRLLARCLQLVRALFYETRHALGLSLRLQEFPHGNLHGDALPTLPELCPRELPLGRPLSGFHGAAMLVAAHQVEDTQLAGLEPTLFSIARSCCLSLSCGQGPLGGNALGSGALSPRQLL